MGHCSEGLLWALIMKIKQIRPSTDRHNTELTNLYPDEELQTSQYLLKVQHSRV